LFLYFFKSMDEFLDRLFMLVVLYNSALISLLAFIY